MGLLVAGSGTVFTVAGNVHRQRTVFGSDLGLDRHRLFHQLLGAAVMVDSWQYRERLFAGEKDLVRAKAGGRMRLRHDGDESGFNTGNRIKQKGHASVTLLC